ncbi:MAG TPA: hypothetical protein VM537_07245 [Anaerolineae bacterium]|nr:hypothetical protein [Anaerolineae bacterium]
MTNEEYANAAWELGRLAFEEGRPPIPAQDPAMMDLIAQNQDKPFGSAVAPLQQYHSGWIQANLAAPMPDDEDDYDSSPDGWDSVTYSAAMYGGSHWPNCLHGEIAGGCSICNPDHNSRG